MDRSRHSPERRYGQFTTVGALRSSWLSGLVASCIVAGCGGGGGASAVGGTPSEQPQGGGVDTGGSTGPDLNRGADSFYFAPGAAMSAPGALDTVAGGSQLLTAWNPNNGGTVLSPGMKVMFFGSAKDCRSGVQGPVVAPEGARMLELASLTGLPDANAGSTLRWAPSANTPDCAEATRAKRGASAVYVNASDAEGSVGMVTSSGVQLDGAVSFFGPYTAGGQNGAGDNAYITGTFVNFRHAGWAADPLQPWLGGTKARLRSEQAMMTASVGDSATMQVKQQMMATFYNNQCRKDQPGKACQIQYLMDTAIVRTGVSNWGGVSWFQQAKVWFDPVQGGIPIVSGPIYASGIATTEAERGLSMWSSQGSASQHQSFSARTFDVTIGLDQLQNVLRITTARTLGKLPGAVTDAEIAGQWGTAWADPAAWSLLSADVGQEVYNPDPGYRAEIGGGFRSLYVGPQ